MGAFGVVPEEPVDQFLVAGRHIRKKQAVRDDESFGQGTVEALNVRVHLRRTGIRVVARNGESDTGIVEVPGELASVVGLYGRHRSEGAVLLQKVRSGSGRVVLVHGGECEAGLGVDAGHDVALDAVHEAHHRVDLNDPLACRTTDLPACAGLFVPEHVALRSSPIGLS